MHLHAVPCFSASHNHRSLGIPSAFGTVTGPELRPGMHNEEGFFTAAASLAAGPRAPIWVSQSLCREACTWIKTQFWLLLILKYKLSMFDSGLKCVVSSWFPVLAMFLYHVCFVIILQCMNINDSNTSFIMFILYVIIPHIGIYSNHDYIDQF